MTSVPPPPAPPVPPPAGWPPAAEYPPPPPARPSLHRSRTDKVVGGVAGGLAEYSGIDPLLWRVGFVALALAGPGIPIYLLLWIFMSAAPGHGPGGSRAERVKEMAGPRSPVPGLTLAGLLIVVGTMVLISRFTDWSLAPRFILGSALLVVGLGLVAAAFSAGRRAKGGLIALGVLLSLALIAAAAEPWRNVDGGIGDRTFDPMTAADVRPVYDAGVGDVTLDLSDIDMSDLDGPVTTRLDAGIGDVDILVPRDADVRIEADSGIGNVEVFGEDGAGDGFHRGTGGDWTGDREPEIVLTIDAGIGDVEVSRA
jgi:phage shock protein PspC (stress-responsive transcriptional regulator)